MLIRTGLGTVAVLVGSVVVAVILRNYLGVVIGTWHILADLYWLVSHDIWIGVGVCFKFLIPKVYSICVGGR